MLKIEARVAEANKQKEINFDSQNYPQYLWIVLRGCLGREKYSIPYYVIAVEEFYLSNIAWIKIQKEENLKKRKIIDKIN